MKRSHIIDLHTHSLLSDGELLPSELARRAEAIGYEAIAITDHADMSNIETVIKAIKKCCRSLNRYWSIKVIPGVEITHVPVQTIMCMVRDARRMGAEIVIGHGETVSEPVLPGTNNAFIKSGVDILAHPGMITEADAKLAKSRRVFLELTTRKNHVMTNKHVLKMGLKHNAPLILNTDAHSYKDLLTEKTRNKILSTLLSGSKNRNIIKEIIYNSYKLAALKIRRI